jgi:hypothetical protein
MITPEGIAQIKKGRKSSKKIKHLTFDSIHVARALDGHIIISLMSNGMCISRDGIIGEQDTGFVINVEGIKKVQIVKEVFIEEEQPDGTWLEIKEESK